MSIKDLAGCTINELEQKMYDNLLPNDWDEIYLSFKEEDCQGTPYSYVNNQFDLIKNGTEYHIANTNLLPEQFAPMSYLSDGTCSSYSNPTTGWFYQAMTIELPFQLPAAIPFRIEYQ